ncbi:MAG: hypothetical protein ACKVQS_08440 [Fimbriimonadaceae bacterium]
MAKLNENEIREILKRAEQIHIGATTEEQSDEKALIKAAEEAGLPRDAVEQALRERLEAQELKATPGDFIFAPSTDGKLYVAEFLHSSAGQTTARFLNGSEATFPSEQAQVAQFNPGCKVQANWPNFGWWTCTVIAFDKPNRLLRLSDGWGSEKSFPLAEVRTIPPKTHSNSLQTQLVNLWDRHKVAIIAVAGALFMLIQLIRRG